MESPLMILFARVFSILDPDMFAKCFINLVESFGETAKQIKNKKYAATLSHPVIAYGSKEVAVASEEIVV